MSTTKKFNIVAKVGEYQDRNTGETKAQWKNVGAVMSGDNGPFIMLDRSFNPAGLPNPDNRSSCLLSLFAPRDGQQQPDQQQAARQPAPQGGQSQYPDFDDSSDLPF